MAFRLSAKTLFLTYPQCSEDVSLEGLYDFILGKSDTICALRVGRERHADGGLHYHVYVQSSTKFNIRDPRWGDFMGQHPNMQSARDPKATWDYCGKDGDTKEMGDAPTASKKRTWSDMLEAPTKDEFMENVKTHFSRDYVLNLEKVQYFANYHYKPQIQEYTDPYNGQYVVPQVLDDWVANSLQTDNVGKLLSTPLR